MVSAVNRAKHLRDFDSLARLLGPNGPARADSARTNGNCSQIGDERPGAAGDAGGCTEPQHSGAPRWFVGCGRVGGHWSAPNSIVRMACASAGAVMSRPNPRLSIVRAKPKKRQQSCSAVARLTRAGQVDGGVELESDPALGRLPSGDGAGHTGSIVKESVPFLDSLSGVVGAEAAGDRRAGRALSSLVVEAIGDGADGWQAAEPRSTVRHVFNTATRMAGRSTSMKPLRSTSRTSSECARKFGGQSAPSRCVGMSRLAWRTRQMSRWSSSGR